MNELEKKYIDAKIAYYEGRPIMSDAAFDVLESKLKELGSKVIEQVGSKRKDFDYAHPGKMLSLKKIQTEKDDYKTEEFENWYDKKISILAQKFNVKRTDKLIYTSPKFDGNAINLIYKGGKLYHALTRGDGVTGKNITDRLSMIIPETINFECNESDFIEVRCEVVIDKKIFNNKYASLSANPRNFVAGILGADEYTEEVIHDLTIVPLYYILNGKHLHSDDVKANFDLPNFYLFSWNPCSYDSYQSELMNWIEKREDFHYQLDGMVITFFPEYRDTLGENSHDTEFCLAIKFIPEGAITDYDGIEWNISKRGEMAPVVLLKPVQLAGTTVKRASGYNAGYIVNNKIGPGATFEIQKAGDIIPEVKQIITPATKAIELPTTCPACGGDLDFDGIHLMCNNEDCIGKAAKKLAYGAALLDLKGIGGKTMQPFAEDFPNIYELMYSVLNPSPECGIDYEKYGFKLGSRSHQIFYDAFKNIKSIPYETVIVMLGYNNVGRKLSAQVAREHCGLTPDYASLERALVAKLHEPEVENYIKQAVLSLESLGIKIDRPKDEAKKEGTVYVCMTGSPKNFGFKTKEEFITKFPNLVEVSLTDKQCNYLITDDYNSSSSKMGVAKKKGIKIVTYGDYK